MSRIEPDAVGFRKKLGPQFDNIGSDPAVDSDGRLTWGDYEQARKQQAQVVGTSRHDDAGTTRVGSEDDR